MKNITYISAGAGSGKTTRIIKKLVNAIKDEKNPCRPSEIMMTTYTRAAAQEMQERAKKKLLESGMPDKANEMGAATIGTIHSVCLRFIQKYWYLIGISPDCQQMDENDFNSYVDRSLFEQVSEEDMLSLEKWRKTLDWKKNDGKGEKGQCRHQKQGEDQQKKALENGFQHGGNHSLMREQGLQVQPLSDHL